jgi:signal transduction histidine kinase
VESIGLPAALQNLAAETSKFFRIDCLLLCPDSTLRIDSHTSLPLYRIVQEAIHNGITHGAATRIEIELTSDGDSFCLVVRDNGRGFDRAAAKGNGMGLRVMDYRARSIGAVLRLISQPKAGTEVRCLIPVPKHMPSKAQGEGQATNLGLPETRST